MPVAFGMGSEEVYPRVILATAKRRGDTIPARQDRRTSLIETALASGSEVCQHDLATFGYPSVLYIGATADRITPRPEDFKVQKVAQVSPEIKDGANRILGTKKFDNLRRINLKADAGNSAFVMQASPPPNAKYYSERNFSLGELCVLKLVRDLMNCADKSLLLTDELELALLFAVRAYGADLRL
ncbi:MAG: hypothetical protein V4441_12320 [Pseudomonadota bacterium]